MKTAILRKVREGADVQRAFFEQAASTLEACVAALAERFRAGGKLLVMGNGGSACDAQHLAVEFQHPILEKRRPLPALVLGVSPALLTAVGNDGDFGRALVEELELLARPGDAVVAHLDLGRLGQRQPRPAPGARAAAADHRLRRARRRRHGRPVRLLPSSCRAGPSTASRRRTPRCCTCCGTRSTSPWGKTMSSEPAVRHGVFGACPVPVVDNQQVLLGHGSGGRLTAELIERLIVPAFANPVLEQLDDRRSCPRHLPGGQRLAFTTDSYVVTPLFFPGGDIGRAGGARHGQRSGDGRGAADGAVAGVHPRGRACRWRCCAG